MEVYLDNAASTQPHKEAIKAMVPYLSSHYANPSTTHKQGKEAKKVIENERKKLAKIMNCKPAEIIFTSGATEANVLAIKGIAEFLYHKTRGKKNQIVLSAVEHASIIEAANQLKKKGFMVTLLSVNKEGHIDLEKLKSLLNKRTALVSIQMVNNETGIIQDLKKISTLCEKADVILHTDLVQGFTKIPFDIKENPLQLISLSAHKIHGPKGAGALFVKEGTGLLPLFPGTQEGGIRAGTENIPAIVGFVKAAELSKKIKYHSIAKLRDEFVKNVLKNIDESELMGDIQNLVPHIANIFFKNLDGEALQQQLSSKGVYVSTASACKQQQKERSHVIAALNVPKEGGNIRFSLSIHTTKKELDYTLKALKEIIPKLRKVYVPPQEDEESFYK
jgi:cysteine desulfurase